MFDEDSDGDEDGNSSTAPLKIRTEFEGSHGQSLLALESKFGGDPRFKLDHRFREDSREQVCESEMDEKGELADKKKVDDLSSGNVLVCINRHDTIS